MADQGVSATKNAALTLEAKLKEASVDPDLFASGTRVLVFAGADINGFSFDDSYSNSHKFVATVRDEGGKTAVGDLAPAGNFPLAGSRDVRAVVQSTSDIRFAVSRLNGEELQTFVFFFAAHFDGILVPNVDSSIASFDRLDPGPQRGQLTDGTVVMSPGCWRITLRGYPMVMKILPRRPCILIDISASDRTVPGAVLQNIRIPFGLRDHRSMIIPGTLSQPRYTVEQHELLFINRESKLTVATFAETKQVTTVKMISWPKWSDMNKWQKEYCIHKGLEHPSIMSLLLGDARYCALYLEYVPGLPLAHHHHRLGQMSKISLENATRILKGLAAGLRYLAEHSIVHNGIGPGNVFFSEERGAVICDFGAAAYTWDPSGISGSSWYFPPEFVKTHSRGLPGDMFAAGITMLFVLRKIPLPGPGVLDVEQMPLQEFSPSAVRSGNAHDTDKMTTWLLKVEGVARALDMRNPIEHLVRRMLQREPGGRINAYDLDMALNGDGGVLRSRL